MPAIAWLRKPATDKGILKKAAIVGTIIIKNPVDFIREMYP